MAETAALFFAYSSFQNVIRAYSFQQHPSETSLELSIPQLGLAAAGAGFATSFILTPIELVKCKMQVQMMNTHTSAHIPPIHATPKPIKKIVQAPIAPNSPPRAHLSTLTSSGSRAEVDAYRKRLPGPFAIIKTTIQDHGVRGLWLGHTGTILRETGGTASWFAVKEYLASSLKSRRLGEGIPGELLPWESAVSGALSGGACVLALYPADTVKSAIQTEDELRSHSKTKQVVQRTTSFWRTAARMYQMHGVKGLYAGCGMTVARAVPSSGLVFVVYDGLNAWFG
ncbi:mitochondrial carrier [Hymenopellis radicata]|nr:mitochondrial carrier [Hymenopellis radicata]